MKIHVQPKKATPSCARTIEQALELLTQLAVSRSVRDRELAPSPLILVVDDSELSRQVLLAALESVQLRAISLGDPAQVLALLEGNTFDLILLDVNMPGMSGIELCQRIKALESNMLTPVMFVSGLKDPEVILESVGSGGVDYVTKPVMLQEISLKTLIHLHQLKLRRVENES